jgi:hypothetical protein
MTTPSLAEAETGLIFESSAGATFQRWPESVMRVTVFWLYLMSNNRGQTTVFRGFGADGTGKSRRPRKPVEQPVEPQFNNLILT